MELRISTITPNQLDALRRIYLEARQQNFTWLNTSAFTLADFDAATKDETIAVALDGKTPVGFVSWWPPDYFVHHLYIDPANTGRGIGTALLAYCLTQVGRPARLKCLQKNVNALHFYQSRGWTIKSAGTSTEGDYWLLSFGNSRQLSRMSDDSDWLNTTENG